MARKVTSQVRNGKLVAERRDLIIGAAIKVFQQKGFHVSTTHDVATVAGITQSNLYNYVRTKDDILYLVCASLMESYNNVMAEVASEFADPHVRLVESMRAVISVMCSQKEKLRLLYNEAHSLKKTDRRLILLEVSKFIKKFQDLIEGYEAVHGPTEVPNKRLSANLLSFVPALVALRSWDLSAHVEPAEMEAGILHFILTGLGVPDLPRPMPVTSELKGGKVKKARVARSAADSGPAKGNKSKSIPEQRSD